jgi:hypothetical protein
MYAGNGEAVREKYLEWVLSIAHGARISSNSMHEPFSLTRAFSKLGVFCRRKMSIYLIDLFRWLP